MILNSVAKHIFHLSQLSPYFYLLNAGAVRNYRCCIDHFLTLISELNILISVYVILTGADLSSWWSTWLVAFTYVHVLVMQINKKLVREIERFCVIAAFYIH